MRFPKIPLLILSLGILSANSAAQWTYTELSVPGTNACETHGQSSSLQVGGSMGSLGIAGFWSGPSGTWTSLKPVGMPFSVAHAANELNQVGSAGPNENDSRACMWSGTAASFVSLHPVGARSSVAYAISPVPAGGGPSTQVGEVVFPNIVHACLWKETAASWVDLNPPGATTTRAFAASSTQQGGYRWDSVQTACLWSGTAASFQSIHPTQYAESSVEGMSETHQVGWIKPWPLSNILHAGIWSGTAASFKDLNPPDCRSSMACGISGPVQVGWVEHGYIAHAAVWTGDADGWLDLHPLLPSKFEESFATSVYSDGVAMSVTGWARTSTPTYSGFVIRGPVPTSDFELTLNKHNVAGQNYVMGTITMAQARPTNIAFTIYDDSSLVTTPATTTVPAAALSRSFAITVAAVTSTINTTIYAKRGKLVRSQPLALTPLIPTAVVFNPSAVTGGLSTTCRTIINGVAGPGGRAIGVFDNSTFATTPGTVTVPPGASDVYFSITTLPVTAVKVVNVTARVSAGEKTGSFRINP